VPNLLGFLGGFRIEKVLESGVVLPVPDPRQALIAYVAKRQAFQRKRFAFKDVI
jgi:hypothetical protein